MINSKNLKILKNIKNNHPKKALSIIIQEGLSFI